MTNIKSNGALEVCTSATDDQNILIQAKKFKNYSKVLKCIQNKDDLRILPIWPFVYKLNNNKQ